MSAHSWCMVSQVMSYPAGAANGCAACAAGRLMGRVCVAKGHRRETSVGARGDVGGFRKAAMRGGALVCMLLLLAQQQRGDGGASSAGCVCWKRGVGVRIGATSHQNDVNLLRRRVVVHIRAEGGGAQQQIGCRTQHGRTCGLLWMLAQGYCTGCTRSVAPCVLQQQQQNVMNSQRCIDTVCCTNAHHASCVADSNQGVSFELAQPRHGAIPGAPSASVSHGGRGFRPRII